VRPASCSAFTKANCVNDAKAKALVLHIIKLVLDGCSFRSSDSASVSRNIYKSMFPDSKYSEIRCGRTKAEYLVTKAIAPWIKSRNVTLFPLKLFGIFVNESTYNSKTRMEFWITVMDNWITVMVFVF